MFEHLVRFSIDQRWLVMLAVLAVAALGVFNYNRLAVDAVADLSNVQVVVNTSAPGSSPLETEQRITFSVETVLAGLPGLEQTRSLSRYGLPQVSQPRNAIENGLTARSMNNVTPIPRPCRRTCDSDVKSTFDSIGKIINQISSPTVRFDLGDLHPTEGLEDGRQRLADADADADADEDPNGEIALENAHRRRPPNAALAVRWSSLVDPQLRPMSVRAACRAGRSMLSSGKASSCSIR